MEEPLACLSTNNRLENPSVTTDALVADFDNIAIYGNFVLKLKSNGSVPVAIDNLTWQLNPSDNPL